MGTAHVDGSFIKTIDKQTIRNHDRPYHGTSDLSSYDYFGQPVQSSRRDARQMWRDVALKADNGGDIYKEIR